MPWEVCSLAGTGGELWGNAASISAIAQTSGKSKGRFSKRAPSLTAQQPPLDSTQHWEYKARPAKTRGQVEKPGTLQLCLSRTPGTEALPTVLWVNGQRLWLVFVPGARCSPRHMGHHLAALSCASPPVTPASGAAQGSAQCIRPRSSSEAGAQTWRREPLWVQPEQLRDRTLCPPTARDLRDKPCSPDGLRPWSPGRELPGQDPAVQPVSRAAV